MKVCLLIDGLGPGGAERSTAHLAIWLKKHSHDVHVAMLYDRQPGFADEVVSHGIRVSYLGNSWRQRFLGLKMLLARENFDLVHSCLFSSDILARLISLLIPCDNLRFTFSIVSNSYGPHRRTDELIKPWKLRIVQWIDATTLKLAKPIAHAVTQSAKINAIVHLGINADDITVIYRGRPAVLPIESRQQHRQILNINSEASVIIHVGRQEHVKNHLGLIAAFERVWERHPNARLLLVGREGNTSEVIQHRLADSPARLAILNLGHRDDVAELLRCADVFVLPSHFEGLSGAMIEAMEAGLPVICSDLDGLREGCEPDRSALLCDPKQPETIAAAMNRLMDDRLLARRLGARGREIFLERFTLDASCQGMLAFFQSVVDRGSCAGHSAH